MASVYIPDFSEMLAVAQSRGADSEAPGLWDGLVGAWPLAEGGGVTAHDLSGFQNHGTLTNMDAGTDHVVTEMGRALDFDGASTYVDLTDGFFAISQRSVSLWFRASALQDDMVFAGGIGGASRWYMNPQADGTIDTRIGENAAVTSSIGYSATAWTHYVATYNAVRAKAYINGRIGSDEANSTLSGAVNVNIGSYSNGSAVVWDGQIAGVCIHNRALVLDETQQLYVEPYAMYTLRRRVYKAAAVGFVSRKHSIIGGGIAA